MGLEAPKTLTRRLVVEEILNMNGAISTFLELAIDIGSSSVEPSLEILFDVSGVRIV